MLNKSLMLTLVGICTAVFMACDSGTNSSGKYSDSEIIGTWYFEENGILNSFKFNQDGTYTFEAKLDDRVISREEGTFEIEDDTVIKTATKCMGVKFTAENPDFGNRIRV